MKKLLITPYFGPFPEWMDKYLEHIKHVNQYGYDWLITTDEEDFSRRVQEVLGFVPTIRPGTPLIHNYRTAYGLLYADKLKDYDFWGITDFDCVYGKIDNFITDSMLEKLDIHSNHHNYICGPWTLFRNIDKVNNLFRLVPQWEGQMRSLDTQPGRWTEVEYSQMIDEQHNAGNINRLYTHFQGKDPNDDSAVTFKDGKLYDHGDEIFMFHFNRNKRYPLK